MLSRLRIQIQKYITDALVKEFSSVELPEVHLEVPADKQHGAFSANIALKSVKVLRKRPVDIAQEFLPIIQKAIEESSLKEKIDKIEIKAPGFINFYLTSRAFYSLLSQVFDEGVSYGRSDFGAQKKIQIEFVSANPTGPLSVAHARQAAVGDSLANILNFIGFKTHCEYYVNDGGNQIRILGLSIQCRAREILGDSVGFPEDGYQGGYIKDMAQVFIEKNNVTNIDQLNVHELSKFMNFGASYLLDVIKKELDDFRVHFDFWAYESKIATKEQIEDTLSFLNKKGLTYQKDGALWFESTRFGDDKDRVLKKGDGAYTYLTPDIVYHKDKFARGFDQVIDILGPDHHGYIQRIKAAAVALGRQDDDLKVLIVQLATIYREGVKVSMSTRGGQYISLREVIDEVGVDAARFFFLMRHIKAHLDFDLELAKKETSENPVYYIQYAHARIHSVNKKAKEAGIHPKKTDFRLLNASEEFELIKKLGGFPEILICCFDQLDPSPLVTYLQDVASCFHKFYDHNRVIDPSNLDLSSERLGLINAAKVIFANGLKLLGISTPERM